MFCCKTKNDDSTIDEIQETNRKLTEENELLKKKNELNILNKENLPVKWDENIDEFVDQWYKTNKDKIDIGVIDFKIFKIDLFPDYLEKHIYKKILKIMFSFFMVAVSPKN